MDLDQLKAAWNEQKCDGYLFENSPVTIAADIRRKAEQMARTYFWRDAGMIATGIGGVIMIGSYILGYQGPVTPMGSFGSAMVMAGGIANLISILSLRLGEHGKRYDVPKRVFLEEEKKRILARIRVTKSYTTSQAVPVALGALIWAWSITKTPMPFVILMAVIVAAYIYCHLMHRSRIKNKMIPMIKDIDRELSEFDARPA